MGSFVDINVRYAESALVTIILDMYATSMAET